MQKRTQPRPPLHQNQTTCYMESELHVFSVFPKHQVEKHLPLLISLREWQLVAANHELHMASEIGNSPLEHLVQAVVP